MIGELKPYEEYKDSGEPWLGKIPRHWGLPRTKNVLKERSEKGFPEEPLLAATQTKGVIRKSEYENRTVLALKDLHLLKLVRENDFVISLRSFQGGIEYARERGIISPAYTILYTEDEHNHQFLSWLFKSKPYIENLKLFVTGIRQGQNIDYAQLSRSRLVLPPAKEQAAIAQFLNYADRRIRRYIRTKQKLIKLLEEQKQSVINEVVTQGLDPDVPLKASGIEWLGDIPDHWNVKRIRHLVDFYGPGIQMGPFGSSLTTLAEQQTGYKLYGQENTISGDFKKGRRWLTSEQYQSLSKYEIQSGDIVLTRKGSIGQCRLVPEGIQTGIADSDTIRVRIDVNQLKSSFFVLLLHDASYIQKQVIASRRGAVLSGLNTMTIANLTLAVPPLEEQASLIEEICARMAEFDSAIEIAETEISLINEFRTRLIADVVTGKLDVREAAAKLPAEVESPEASAPELIEDDIVSEDDLDDFHEPLEDAA